MPCNETRFHPIDVEVFSVAVLFNTMFPHPMGLVVFNVAILFKSSLSHRTAVAAFNMYMLVAVAVFLFMQRNSVPFYTCCSV